MLTISRKKHLIVLALIAVAGLGASGCMRSPEAREARFLSRGKDAMKRQDYPRAALEFLNAVKAMPRDAEAYYQLGLAYLAAGDLQRGANYLHKATELNPKHMEAQLRLATLMVTSRSDDMVHDAQKRLMDALGASPDNPDILDVLALSSLRLGKPEDAEQELRQALDKAPAHLQASVQLAKIKLEHKDLAGAQVVLEQAVKAAPQSADAALALGRLYLVSGKPDLAEVQVRRALQIDPKKGPALLTLADIQFRAGHVDQTEQTLRQISQLPDPAYKPLHAAFLFQTGKRDAAIGEFEKLAKDAPDDRTARMRLIAAYASMGRVGDAERVLKEALAKNPKDTDALLRRSQLYVASGKFSEAESDLRQVLHFEPNSASAHYYLSRVYGAQHNALSQRQELAEALRINPDLLGARMELAALMINSNAASTALKLMDETPEEQKKSPLAIAERNWVLLAMGDKAEAQKGIAQGLATARTPELLLQDGVLKLRNQDFKGAQASIDDVLKVQPENLQAWTVLIQVYTGQKQPQKAAERLHKAIAERPKSIALHLLLGRWLAQTGKMPDARAEFEEAKKVDPTATAVDLALAQLDMMQGNSDAVRQRLTPVAAAQPHNTNALLLLAAADEKSGATNDAINRYRAVVDTDRSNLQALNNLAYLLAKDNPDEALKYAQQAGELAPDNPAVQDTLGWVCYRKGIYDTAVAHLKIAVDKDGTPRREYHLGMAYLKAGNEQLGQKMLRAALQTDPKLATTQGW